jgi:Tol biopolymer transport system component
LRRFKREAQVLERLQHPNIVRYYGLEESDGSAYILMDFIDGLTLRKEIFLNRKGIRPPRILQIMQPVCSALHYAHQMGLIHCDVKPVNIMIHRNSIVYLTDFGIARMKEARTQTVIGTGTPAYMPPEQFQGSPPTPASDIYALGMVLYEMITGGERPFTGEAAPAGNITERMVWEKCNALPLPPSQFNPEVMPELEMVALHCLETRAEDRYGSALEVLAALQFAVRGDGSEMDVNTLTDLNLQSRDVVNTEQQENATENTLSIDIIGTSQQFESPEIDNCGGAAEELPAVEMMGDEELLIAETFGEAGSHDDEARDVLQSKRNTHLNLRAPTRWIFGAVLIFILVVSALFLTGEPPYFPEPLVLAAVSESTQTPTIQNTQTQLVLTDTVTPTITLTSTQTPPPPSATPEPAPTQLGGKNGRIAFASDRTGSVQIWIMSASDPGDRQQLTDIQGGACQPEWSPDGKKIAFTSSCNGPRLTYPGGKIKTINLESGKISDLNLPGSVFDPAWSPDGRILAYTTLILGRTEIHAVNLIDGSIRVLAQRGKNNANPAWSPDGELLAFTSDVNGLDEIWVTRKDGGSQEVMTQAGLLKYYTRPVWSPVNQKLVAASMKELNTDPHIPVLVMIDQENPREGGRALMKEPVWIEDSSFSPDGQWLAFWTRMPGNNMEILRVNLRGLVVQLTDHKARDFHPSWSK